MRAAVDSTWARAAVLGLLVLPGLLPAFAVELPDVGTVRSWVDGAGPWTWTGIVLGVPVVCLVLPVTVLFAVFPGPISIVSLAQ